MLCTEKRLYQTINYYFMGAELYTTPGEFVTLPTKVSQFDFGTPHRLAKSIFYSSDILIGSSYVLR